MQEVFGTIGEGPKTEYHIGAIGRWTFVIATLLFALGVWQGHYFLSIAVLLAEVMLTIWIQQGAVVAKIIHWLVAFSLILGLVYYVFFIEPDFFWILDSYLIPHPQTTTYTPNPGSKSDLR